MRPLEDRWEIRQLRILGLNYQNTTLIWEKTTEIQDIILQPFYHLDWAAEQLFANGWVNYRLEKAREAA